MKTSTATSTRGDDHFDGLAEAARRRAAAFAGRPIFRTRRGEDEDALFAVYLAGLAEEDRQPHNCHCCRHFLERYGGLAAVNPDGTIQSILWGDSADVPPVYAAAVAALAGAVRAAKIEDVFLDDKAAWGVAQTGEWRHFSVPALARFSHPLKTAGQAMAEKREEHGMLQRGLAESPLELVQRAVALLETDTLYRSEKVLGPAKWLLDLHEKRHATKNRRVQDNLTWLAVATAPAGFCHVRSTMIGTLLEDLAGGAPAAEAARRFKDKMHPLQYQRPTAPPSEVDIAQAEKVMAALKSAGALDRRFAKLADLQPLWTPRAKEAEKGEGVFGHLRAAAKTEAATLSVDALIDITWEKFAREVLPSAEKIECLVPDRGAFVALVTAGNPDAPPILQWDFEGRRNPVSWYFYHGGSAASVWNLRGGAFCEVPAITLSPAHWNAERPAKNQAHMAVLILKGAKDTRHELGGGLFVETLKSEYHGIRRTLEAHFNRSTIAGRDEAEACGIALQSGANASWNVVLRVARRGIVALYRPDRWD